MSKLLPFAIAAVAVFLVHCSDASTSPAESPVTVPERTTSATLPTKGETTASPPAVPRPFAEPLPASGPGAWTWFGEDEWAGVPQCMDGSKTGLGVNRSPTGSSKVLVFMMGGGACFDGQTCAIADHALSADHANESDFAEWSTSVGRGAVMNRDRAENPFRDWNYVYVPYCSGDVFSGANSNGFEGRPQLGFKNVEAYLPRLQSTFRDAEKLVLSGSSAGGYGAAYNYVQVQKAFDWLDVTMIDDSGPPFGSTFTPPCLQEKWKTTWLMDTTSPVAGPFPLGAGATTGKGGGLYTLVQQIIVDHPKSKFAFISHEADIVMRYFHGIGHSRNCALPGLLSADFFADGLREVRTITGDLSTFYGPGSGHMYFTKDAEMYETTVDGITLAEWLTHVATAGDEPKRVPAQF